MFDAASRYAAQPHATWVDEHGRSRVYVTLREVPAAIAAQSFDRRHEVTDHDRLDRIAWQEVGDPQQFWRLADVNGALHPDELTAVTGRRLLVPYEGRDGGDRQGRAPR
jgi:hypothetical protein